jgi:hypothetical protein
MAPPKFVIKIGRQYWHRGKDFDDRSWGSRKQATEFSLKEARVYAREWKKDGAIAILVAEE